MKPLNKILDTIHSFPEGIRMLMAIGIMIMSAIFLFTLWKGSISYEIAAPDLKLSPQISSKPEETKEETAEVLSPAQGLEESFKSLRQFIEGVSLEVPSADDLTKQAQSVLREAAGMWNGFMDKVWRWVYAP